MRSLSKIVLYGIWTTLSVNGEDCLFMTSGESSKILNVLKNRNHQPPEQRNKSKKYKLSGIFYVDQNRWTVWINDIPYSSIGQQSDFSIDAVTEDGVSLTTNDGSTVNLSVEVGYDENQNEEPKSQNEEKQKARGPDRPQE
jgi:hypothetical protein